MALQNEFKITALNSLQIIVVDLKTVRDFSQVLLCYFVLLKV
jgi:hypothetical protein